MKNKILSTTLVVLISLSSLFAQNKPDALRDAKLTAQATLNLDFEKILEFTHPKVAEVSGGKEALLSVMKTTFKDLELQNFKFISVDVNSVSDIVQEQGEYRCLVSTINLMQVSDMTIKSISSLVGFYLKDADHWVFVEANKMKNPQALRTFFPDFETRLNIPDDKVERIN